MRRALLALALLLAPVAAQAQCEGQDLRLTLTGEERARLDALMQDMPYPEGNRWRAERGDEVIHLVGTLHLSDPRLDAPFERLKPVIAEAGALLLELPKSEQDKLIEAMTTRPELLLLTEQTLPELMPEEDWQMLAEAARARGVPAVMAAKMRPWYLSMMLAIPACAATAMQEQDGLDVRLEALATARGVPTVALEPYDTIFALFNEEPLDEQIEMMGASLAAGGEEDADSFATTIAAYFDEQAGEMWKFSEILMTRTGLYAPDEASALMAESTDALLARRNHAWLPILLQTAAESEAPVVAAFGAAHLPGEDGVLQLLEDEGFTITREAF
jgi:uncharacterized protein